MTPFSPSHRLVGITAHRLFLFKVNGVVKEVLRVVQVRVALAVNLLLLRRLVLPAYTRQMLMYRDVRVM